MLDYLWEYVTLWFSQSLKAYNPIVWLLHMKIYCNRSVGTEGFYMVLAAREDTLCGLLEILNKPTEGALDCCEMLAEL